MIPIYFLIGIAYVIINGTLRNMYNDDDWQLPLAHIAIWPICFICLVISRIERFKNKNWKI